MGVYGALTLKLPPITPKSYGDQQSNNKRLRTLKPLVFLVFNLTACVGSKWTRHIKPHFILQNRFLT